MFCVLVIFIKNFDPINIRRPWAPEITMFCSKVMMIKTFNPIKSRKPWPPISISHIFQQCPFSSWPLLFYSYWFGFYFFFETLLFVKCCQLIYLSRLKQLYVGNKTERFSYKCGCGICRCHACIKAFKGRATGIKGFELLVI